MFEGERSAIVRVKRNVKFRVERGRPSSALSKITRPEAGKVLVRSRLFDLLDNALERPLVWIESDAGSGKTTLVSSYLRERKLPSIWYQCDEGDGDLPTFFYYMSLAALKVNPHRKSLPLLTPEYAAGIPTFTRRYFEGLYGYLARGGVVVLDNYQKVPQDSPLHATLAGGLDLVPGGVQVIVASRFAPPPAFARLKAGKSMSLMGWNELRFTPEEVSDLVGAVRRGRCLDLDCPGPKALYEKSSGWAAGLQLMIEATEPAREAASQGAPGTALCHCIESLNWREDVFAYFASEVMARTDPAVCDFLLLTSFLPHVTAGIAAHLTGRADARAILTELSRRHYFTEWHPGETPVYQYHPLFREFLQARARGTFDSAELQRVRKRGAELLEKEGSHEDALEMYLAAADYGAAVPLILQGAGRLISQGRVQAVERHLSCLPGELIATTPGLLHIAGLIRLPFDVKEARSFLEKAFRLFAENHDYPEAIAVCGCLLEAIIIEGSSYETVEEYVERLDDMAGASPRAGAAADPISGVVLFALAFRNPGHRSLPSWLERAEAAVMKSGNVAATLKLCNYLMGSYLFKGDYCSVTRLMHILEPIGKEAVQEPVLHLLCRLLEAYHRVFVLADAEGGVSVAREAIGYGHRTGVVIYEFWLSYLIVIASVSTGELSAAESCLEGMMQGVHDAPAVRFADLMVLSGALGLGKSDWSNAAEYFKRSVETFHKAGASFSEASSRVNGAHALFELGDEKAALRELSLAARRNWGHSAMVRYKGLVTEAHFHLKKGSREAGLAALRDAFHLAKTRGLRLAPLWNREHSSRVCAEALEAGIERDFVCDLVRGHRLVPPLKTGLTTDAWPWPLKIYTLGRFEILKEGEQIHLDGRVQKKPLEMLKALIAFGGKHVPEERLIDALWPEAAGDAARVSFKTTLHRLRQGLGDEQFVLLKNGRVSLSEDRCWIDVTAFQRAAAALESGGTPEKRILMQRLLGFYQGPFLPGDETQGWSAPMRERTGRRFVRLVGTAAADLRRQRRFAEAAHYYETALEIEELDEDLACGLMECQARMRRKDRVAGTYKRYCDALRVRLEIGPSEEARERYERLMKKEK